MRRTNGISSLIFGNNMCVCEQDRATLKSDPSGYADRNTDSGKDCRPHLLIRLTRHSYQLGSGFFIAQN